MPVPVSITLIRSTPLSPHLNCIGLLLLNDGNNVTTTSIEPIVFI